MSMYRVGVEIAMHGNASQFLGIIVKDLIGMNGQVNKAVAGLGRVKMALAGVGSIMAGHAILGGVGSLVEHGNKLVKIQQDMAQAGASQIQIQEALNKSLELTAKYRNMGVTETMKLINDSRGIFGDMDEGVKFAESVTKSGSFLKAYMGGEAGGNAEKSLRKELDAALKSGELSSKLKPAEMEKHIQELTAMKVAFGDQLKIGQYLTAQRNAKQSLRSTDDAFRYGMFPAMVQENGPNAGTMLMTAFSKIVNGTGNRTRSLEKMAELGLLNKDEILYGKDGHAKGLKDANAIVNNKEAAMNFASYVNGTIKPMLEKQLDKEGVHGDLERQIRTGQLVGQMWPDRQAAQAISEMLQQFTKFSKDAKLIQDAYQKLQGGGAEKYVDNSYEGQKQAFETQWDNFLQLMGAPLVGRATEMLSQLNSALSGMTQWAAANPEMAKNIGTALAALGAGLTALGVVLLGGAIVAAIGAGGWLIGGLAALAGVMAGLAVAFPRVYQHFATLASDIGNIFKDIWNAFDFAKQTPEIVARERQAIFDFAKDIGTLINDALLGIPGMVAGAIHSMASGIVNAIKNALSFGTPSGGVGDGGEGMGANVKKSSYNAPTVAGTSKHAMNGNVIMDGKKVGRIALAAVSSSETRAGSISGYDTSLHPDFASA